MAPRAIPIVILLVFFAFSCTNKRAARYIEYPDTLLQLPPKREIPVLRILDYKNHSQGVVQPLWLREYLDNGIAGCESLAAYSGSYLFIASIHSTRLPVVLQWAENYYPDRDFSRLAAERIQKRLERDLTDRIPDKVYGPNYEKAIKAVHYNAFWGAMRLDDSWVEAVSVPDGDEKPKEPHYWGFILVSIPRETLEIQVNELLSKISNSKTSGGRSATKDQNAAFEYVKGNFFDLF